MNESLKQLSLARKFLWKSFTINDELKVLGDGQNFYPESFISDTHNLQNEFNIQDKMERATEKM